MRLSHRRKLPWRNVNSKQTFDTLLHPIAYYQSACRETPKRCNRFGFVKCGKGLLCTDNDELLCCKIGTVELEAGEGCALSK
jgi:hypothetical protein